MYVFLNLGIIVLIRKMISNLKIKGEEFRMLNQEQNLKMIEAHPLILVSIAQKKLNKISNFIPTTCESRNDMFSSQFNVYFYLTTIEPWLRCFSEYTR